jgi:3-methyladenine DNA glycosylase AlkD
MIHPYCRPLVASFTRNGDREAARGMASYMKNQFPFLGIKTPLRKELFNAFLKENGLPVQGELHSVVSALWELPEREYQYVAISLFDKFKKKYREEDILMVEKIITKKSWWDTVDGVASWIAGDYFRKFPDKIRSVTRRWMDSENMWLQRSALLFQLHYKQQTDEGLLFGYIKELTSSPEFFIRKAIGWVLREYSKTAPARVQQFVDETSLSALSRKEALKVINREKFS